MPTTRAQRALSGLALIVALSAPSHGQAQISRHPTGVNVNGQDATTVFITFGNLDGYVADEALWCGELIPAAPDIGAMCDPATIFGSLPLRFDQSRTSGDQGFTDIMSIPPSVARRAYQAAEGGAESSFFYVRRFVDPQGMRPDQYVTVTCRMTGGGARVPFALLDVQVGFKTEATVQTLAAGEAAPPLEARIRYNGTGRLQGRWEVVMPGEEPPTETDLLTEGTLPVELRGTQKRYTELERFNHFLPPTGTFTLPGPDPSTLPTDAQGPYQILLRIEETADKEGDSSLDAAGAGTGTVRSAAVAGFPMPVLLYYVGADAGERTKTFDLLAPAVAAALDPEAPVVFTWSASPQAVLYRFQARTYAGDLVVSALLGNGVTSYSAPPFLVDRTPDGFQWRVLALTADGTTAESAPWRNATWRTVR